MAKESGGTGSGWAALVLALLTLSVFFVLKNFGPESAIRRFHQAAVAGDQTELQKVSVQSVRSQSVSILQQNLRRFAQIGATVRQTRVQRSPDVVIAQVDYLGPDSAASIFWVVARRPEGWKVDANATLDLVRQSMGF